jgi:hypothetical protein
MTKKTVVLKPEILDAINPTPSHFAKKVKPFLGNGISRLVGSVVLPAPKPTYRKRLRRRNYVIRPLTQKPFECLGGLR